MIGRLYRGLALAALAVAAVPAPRAAELEVTVDGVTSDRGVLMIGLYDSEEGFDKATKLYNREDGFVRDQGRIVGAAIRVNTGIRSVTFPDLAPGRYAVMVFQDQNANGKLDRAFLIPQEPYGFSNNAKGFLGPASFDAATFPLGDERKQITVRLD
jgi:uncharacterized protein (DUF2141 family)